MKIQIKKLEKKLKRKFNKNTKSTGLDIAERTGVCWIKVNSKYLYIDWTFIKFDNTNIKLMYENMVNGFADVMPKDAYTIIENIYFGRNKQTCLQLGRFNGFVISEAVRKKVKWELIGASSARAKLGINTNKYGKGKSKIAVSDWIQENLGIYLEDPDISDAIVLALLGTIKEMDFRPQYEIEGKSKPKRRKKK